MKKLVLYIWKFLRNYKRFLALFFLFAIILSVIALIEPYIYKTVIDYLILSDDLKFSHVALLLLIWGVFSVFSSGIMLVYRYMGDRTFMRVMTDFFNYAYSKMMNLDIKKHLSKRSGELVKKIDTGGWAIFDLLFQSLIDLLPTAITFFAVIVFAFYFNWKMALISISLMPLYIFVFIYGGTKTVKVQKKSIKNFEKITGQAFDIVANILVVKSFSAEKKEKKKFYEMLNYGLEQDKKIAKLFAYVTSAQNLLNILNKLLIFAGGVFFIIHKEMSVGDLILFLSLSGFIYEPIISMSYFFRNFMRHKSELLSVRKALEDVVEIEDLPNAKKIILRKADLVFENVSFKYSSTKKLFSGLSFEIPAHKITAIVGHSGSGKSTLVSLINRFYDVTKGAIKINGRDIREFTLASLRKNIGIVLQDNSMFNDTIFNNIKYGRPAATKKEVFDAAKKARIHNFIMSLPKKYETKVGERGLKLSGGERQRVAIARAILKNPPILILDEATSALDSETEKLIQTALAEVMKGRTTIIIAHRLSTVRKADKILVFSRGKLKEQGSHEELIKAKGRYAKMVDMQVKGFFE